MWIFGAAFILKVTIDYKRQPGHYLTIGTHMFKKWLCLNCLWRTVILGASQGTKISFV